MPTEKWETVRAVASRAYSDAIDAMACIEILERGNHLAITKDLNDARAWRAAKIIKHALLDRILFISMRAIDPIRKPGDRHLRVAFELLTDPAVVAYALVEAEIVEAQALWADALSDPRPAKLRHYRNKHAAHISTPDPSVETPIIIELFGFARRTASIAEKLAYATGAMAISLHAQLEAYEESADAFWSRWGEDHTM